LDPDRAGVLAARTRANRKYGMSRASDVEPRDYRRDIDGLRGIAVLSVILYHINGRLLPGGFVGVDIFFVISGYLISLHIFNEIESGRFSLVEFYRRRIKRIAPAMLPSWPPPFSPPRCCSCG